MAVAGDGYRFAPEERPLFIGSPFTPAHPARRRLTYASVAVLIGLSAALGNSLVSANVANLAGAMGVYAIDASWLLAIYVAMNAGANLLLIKARTQFGIHPVSYGLLVAYALAATWQLLLPNFPAALSMRGISGMAAAGLTTLGIYYLVQALPAKARPLALVIGIVIPQLTMPMARLFPVEMLALGSWQGLHLIEAGVALAALTAIVLVPLPPSERRRVFERLDFVSIALLLPAIVLLCGALAQGRFRWWTDTPWLGWSLAASVPMFAAAILIERNRRHPLLYIDWFGTKDILRFAMVAVLVRLALAEQTYGAVGLLTSSGLNNDQLRGLFAIVLLAMVLGLAASVATLSQARLPYQVMIAALLIAAGAWLDSHGNHLTRPAQLYWSQALIAFGACLFIGPALLYGFIRMIERGPDFLISFVVLFSLTQNIGGLAGSALLGSWQVVAVRAHAQALSEQLSIGAPLVAERIQQSAQVLGGVLVDPSARATQGASLLGRELAREANVLAFNDVFRAVAALALLTAVYVGYLIVLYAMRRRRHSDRSAPA